ncbi:hypothetical protein CPJCM30710_08650 [Clostridium polyendosporum]|uniref:SGNH hydrolase-type esterase domain-containing protein n=1 Tax=Clostridium polyendosporum TaxID=69208 RepID=A0A919VDN2_9CLOT|nr:GDSL-type esterase/lipase family protein [Clostridium polyendosporum]GIM28199.1 hypothetical protein CPJCM30710_08650 [Clostridium polyendosporum]
MVVKSSHCCFHYSALGDSIALGVGATNNYGYVNYFRDFLSTLYNCVDLTNHAVVGLSSGNLLNQLKQNTSIREDVKNASVITISIGGANLLRCITNGNINDACATNGVLAFIQDWPQIMNEIRNSIVSKAEILVMTVYNPLTGVNPNYNKVENYIQQINYVISHLGYRFMYKYKVVDVHEHFQGLFPDGNWKVCTWTHFCEPSPNPHPTDSGHLEIARLHEIIYGENYCYHD